MIWHRQRWLLLGWCVMLVWSLGGVAQPHPAAAAVPAGLTAADWQAITAQLPHAPIAAPVLGQQAYVKASNTGTNDRFGLSVAVDGDTVVIGAPYEDSNATGINSTPNENAQDSGAAYVFVRTNGTWSQQAYLKASNTGAGDYFGYTVAVNGDIIVVGAPQEDSKATVVGGNEQDNSAFGSGAAYVFGRSGTLWSQQAYLKASNTDEGDSFGISVAVSGTIIVVGADYEDSSATGVGGSQSDNSASQSGAAYVFGRINNVWGYQVYLKASNTGKDDHFGRSVGVSGTTIVVGAYGEDSNATGVGGNQQDNSAASAGAAYVFGRTNNVWSQQAYLKASNTDAQDYFGWSVAVSGTTIVVGAYGEDSKATGVDGNQQDNSLAGAGAAYVFVPFFDSWVQYTYLKASNTDTQDNFGYSVAVSGTTIVVGAYSEDSNATGVGGTTSDNTAFDSGAAYVFAYDSTAQLWNQSYLKASNTDTADLFGMSVAVSGSTIVVGAPYEDSNATGVNGNQTNDAADADTGAAYVYGVFDNTVYIPLVLR